MAYVNGRQAPSDPAEIACMRRRVTPVECRANCTKATPV